MKRSVAMMAVVAFSAMAAPLMAAEVEPAPPSGSSNWDWSTWIDTDTPGSNMDHVVGEELCAAPPILVPPSLGVAG